MMGAVAPGRWCSSCSACCAPAARWRSAGWLLLAARRARPAATPAAVALALTALLGAARRRARAAAACSPALPRPRATSPGCGASTACSPTTGATRASRRSGRWCSRWRSSSCCNSRSLACVAAAIRRRSARALAIARLRGDVPAAVRGRRAGAGAQPLRRRLAPARAGAALAGARAGRAVDLRSQPLHHRLSRPALPVESGRAARRRRCCWRWRCWRSARCAHGDDLRFSPSRAVAFQSFSLLVIGAYLVVDGAGRAGARLRRRRARAAGPGRLPRRSPARWRWPSLPSRRLRGWLRVDAGQAPVPAPLRLSRRMAALHRARSAAAAPDARAAARARRPGGRRHRRQPGRPAADSAATTAGWRSPRAGSGRQIDVPAEALTAAALRVLRARAVHRRSRRPARGPVAAARPRRVPGLAAATSRAPGRWCRCSITSGWSAWSCWRGRRSRAGSTGRISTCCASSAASSPAISPSRPSQDALGEAAAVRRVQPPHRLRDARHQEPGQPARAAGAQRRAACRQSRVPRRHAGDAAQQRRQAATRCSRGSAATARTAARRPRAGRARRARSPSGRALRRAARGRRRRATRRARCSADREALEQALVHLVQNAIDASAGGRAGVPRRAQRRTARRRSR